MGKITTKHQSIGHLSSQSSSLNLCSIESLGWSAVYWFQTPSFSKMYTYLRILLMYIISSSKNGGSLGSGHFDIAIMSNTRLFITSVAPWQDVVYVELLSQQSLGSHCYDSETLAFWVELQLDCQELWLVNSCELNHFIITFSKFVGRNCLNLCDATSFSRFYRKFSKSISQ